eukprot:1137392-Pelagomonas_calceolata.AAC.4
MLQLSLLQAVLAGAKDQLPPREAERKPPSSVPSDINRRGRSLLTFATCRGGTTKAETGPTAQLPSDPRDWAHILLLPP